jgi:D-alanyl-D-alanine-carboxypeptidase/D-alanyl-D-alanine-endopeptidase
MRSLLKRCIVAWSLLACAAAAPANAGLLPERVEKAAQERVAAGAVQTLVFGMVDGDRSEVVGFGRLDDGRTPDGDTVYEIGSITKTFTATLLAREVLAGRLTLDTPVVRLLDGFKVPSRNGKEITLGSLATQYSGLPRLPANMPRSDPANPYADYDAAKLKEFLADYELPRDPDATYEYSNLGFGLLGYALAQSEHVDYAAMADDGLFRPLGMTMSGVAFTDTMRAHLAPGHDDNGKPAGNWDINALAGAGAIRSTANDMVRYLKANMGRDPSPLAEAMKFAREPRRDMNRNMRIGLAWITTAKGIVWHNGGTGGYRSFLGFDADRQRGVVILCNTAIDIDDLGFATLDPKARLRPVFKAVALPDASLDDYVGSYRLTDKMLIKIFRMKDGLFARATGQSAIPIFPSAPNEFFARAGWISATFTRDSEGVVNGLVLHQNGDRPAPKLSASELPPEPNEISLDAAALGAFTGRYKFNFGILDVELNGDHLEAQLSGQPAFPVFASGSDQFFYKIVEAQLTFERDADRKITAVVLHQNGRDMRALRLDAPH